MPLLKNATPFVTGPIDAPISASSTTLSLGQGDHELIVDMSDDDPESNSSDFTAAIAWGDGTASQETLTGTDFEWLRHARRSRLLGQRPVYLHGDDQRHRGRRRRRQAARSRRAGPRSLRASTVQGRGITGHPFVRRRPCCSSISR